MNPTTTLIVLGAAAVLLAFLLLAVWHGLFIKVKALRRQEEILKKYFQERQDQLPLLVETYRRGMSQASPASAYLNNVVECRAEARLAPNFAARLKAEEILEGKLKTFIAQARGNEALKKDLNWLEARTELQKQTRAIAAALEQYEQLNSVLAAQSLRFPSKLFRGYVRKYLWAGR